MNKVFVIMPFGKGFDDIYEKIYAPAIRKVGLEPLRADEIYNNQPIIQDIQNSIHNAKVILADVTGRNPNVNYELGAAHALGKEVIILTANPEDVPSDYRHIRYIEYNRHDIDWSAELSIAIEKTLNTVLSRMPEDNGGVYDSGFGLFAEPDDGFDSHEEGGEDLLEVAIAEGFKYEYCNQTYDILTYDDNHIKIHVRSGESDILCAATVYLLNKYSLAPINETLPNNHYLKMRSVFIDNHATYSFDVDYIYDSGSLPVFTRKELVKMLSNEFDGQLFEPQIRFLEANIGQKNIDINDEKYYVDVTLPEERNPISWRKGYFVAEIENTYVIENYHSFYRLKGLLPLGAIQEDSYASDESHWLADWGQTEPRCSCGDVVRFRMEKVYSLANRGHATQARNINFSEFELVYKNN